MRPNVMPRVHLVCRLLLEKKKKLRSRILQIDRAPVPWQLCERGQCVAHRAVEGRRRANDHLFSLLVPFPPPSARRAGACCQTGFLTGPRTSFAAPSFFFIDQTSPPASTLSLPGPLPTFGPGRPPWPAGFCRGGSRMRPPVTGRA